MTEPTRSQGRRELKDNVGTVDTERALNLSAAGEKEVQQRLTALDLYKGPATGALDPGDPRLRSRNGRRSAALRRHRSSIPPQVAALRADSETEYQKFLAAEPAVQPAAARAPRRALAKPSPKPPVMRAAKPSRASDARSTRGQANEPKSAMKQRIRPRLRRRRLSFLAAAPPGGTAAGLPELPTDPGMGGRPPGFWMGSSGGLLLRGLRH